MHKHFKLKNGINVITIPLRGTKAVTVLALFPVGSRYESRQLSGASHFVEHMMFKGTEKRPTYLEISRELDSAGAEYNAFTYKDCTGYYVKIAAENAELAFDLVSDMIFHSKFDAAEMDKERGVIIEELRMYEDNPLMAVDHLSDKATFGDHPLGWDIAGTMRTLKSLTRARLFAYYKKYYVPHNMVLAVAGGINAGVLKHLRYFSGEKAKGGKNLQNNYRRFVWPRTAPGLARRVEVSRRKLDQASVIISFPGIRQKDPDRYAAAVLFNILGGGMSSRLFVEVREKRGLAYVINAGAAAFGDVGQASIQAGLDPARFADALKVIKGELLKIRREPVSAKELADAKSNIAGKLELAMEDSSDQAQWYARQFWFLDKTETPEEFIGGIKKVAAADIFRLANKIFDLNQLRLAVVGPNAKGKIVQIVQKISK